MTSPYALFKTDADLESGKGITIDYGDFKIIVHRAGGSNKKYGDVLNRKIGPVRRQIQAGTLSAEVSNRLMAEVYAESIIVGWENVTDEAGKKMAFSRENVVKFLTDLPDLFLDIQTEADRLANFRKEEIEADAKNSVKS